MGAKKQHARFCSGKLNVLIFRNAADYASELREGGAVRALGCLSSDVWNGRQRIQFIAETIAAE